MREELRKKFDENKYKLCTLIDIDSSSLLTRLVAKDVITSDQKEIITAKSTKPEKVEKLLDVLKERNDECYEIFCYELFKEQKDLVENFLQSHDAELSETKPIGILYGSGSCQRNFINKCFKKLVATMDSCNGLADSLREKGILSPEQHSEVLSKKPYDDQNRIVVDIVSHQIMMCKDLFIEALLETSQEHVVEIVLNPDLAIVNLKENARPLTFDELRQIDDSLFCLVNLLDTYRSEFLLKLQAHRIITPEHVDRIEGFDGRDDREIKRNRNKELLQIMRRRKYTDFVGFKELLRDTFQDYAIAILERCNIPLHIRFANLKEEDRKVIERRVANILTGLADENDVEVRLTAEQKSIILKILTAFEKHGIKLVAVAPVNSIVVFMLCPSTESLRNLKNLYESGSLHQMLQELVDCLSDSSNQCILEVSICDDAFKKCFARFEVLYLNQLPWEMVELLLRKSAYLMCNSLSSVMCNNECKGGFEEYMLYLRSMESKTCNTLISVCYAWGKVIERRHKQFLNGVKHKIIVDHIYLSRAMIVERMDIQHGLLDCLVRKKVISKKKKVPTATLR